MNEELLTVTGIGYSFTISCIIAYFPLVVELPEIVYHLARARGIERRWRAAASKLDATPEGGDAFVSVGGVVECVTPEAPAVVLGVPYRHSRFRVALIERADAQPFRLRLDDGRVVEVDPLGDVNLEFKVERVSGPHVGDPFFWFAFRHGSRVTITGPIRREQHKQPGAADGYRDAGARWVLRIGPSGSDRPLGISQRDVSATGARVHRDIAIVASVAAAIWFLAFAPFHLLVVAGSPRSATISATKQVERRYCDGHRQVTAVLDGSDGATVSGDLCNENYREVDVGDRIRVLVFRPWTMIHDYGDRPSVHPMALAPLFVGFVFRAVAMLAAAANGWKRVRLRLEPLRLPYEGDG